MKRYPGCTLEKLKQLEYPLQELIYVSYVEHCPNWEVTRNSRFNVIHFIRSGQMTFTVDGKTYQCKQNSLICRDPLENITIRNASHTDSCAIYTILFFFKNGISFQSLGVPRVICSESPYLLDLVRKIYLTHVGQGVAYKIKEIAEFSELLYALVTHKLNADKAFLVDKNIGIAMQYVRQNYNQTITVEDLSQMSGYSPSHFRRLFVRNCGVSPQSYIINCKIDMAKIFLLERSKGVSEISEELKFCNPSYFCRIFKEKTGLTPYQFQKQAEVRDVEEIYDE